MDRARLVDQLTYLILRTLQGAGNYERAWWRSEIVDHDPGLGVYFTNAATAFKILDETRRRADAYPYVITWEPAVANA